MGIIKGGGLVIASIALVILLSASNVYLTLDMSLEYDIIAPEISSTLMQFGDVNSGVSNIIDSAYPYLVDYCAPHPDFLYKGVYNNVVIPCSTVSSGMSATLNYLSSDISLGQDVVTLSSAVDSGHGLMVDYCEGHESVYYKDNATNLEVNITCSDVVSGKDVLKASAVTDLVDQVYYGEYDCEFWNCLKKTGSPFFLVSQKAKSYWSSKFYSNLIFILIAIVAMFLFIENKFNLPILVGGASILSALPMSKIDSVLIFVIRPFLGGMDMLKIMDAETLVSMVMVFFTRSGFVFWLGIITGILLIALGIGLRIWAISTGNDKKMFSKEDVKNIIKKEIKKKKRK